MNPVLLIAAIVAALSVIGHFMAKGMVELGEMHRAHDAHAQLLDDEAAALRQRQGVEL